MTATQIQRIPIEQLQEIPSFTQQIMQQMAAEEDKFYRQIMQQVLGREPQLEHAKDFSLASHIDYPDRELIAYKSVVLGRITKGWAVDNVIANSFTWSFEPGITTFR